jgi:hypothetical protein
VIRRIAVRRFWIVLALGLALLPALGLAQVSTRAPWGVGESRGEDLQVSLITFGPGAALYEWWGHGAIAIEDTRLQQARLYNFGMFDFEKFASFALGRLEFYVAEDSVPYTLRSYAREDRDVTVQILSLSPAARLAVAQRLSDNVLPQNRNYLYHHYFDNCATRLRDAIDFALGGQLHQEEKGPGRFTLREQTRRFTAVSPPMSALLDFMMNDSIDRPISQWQEAFLPDVLSHQVASASYVDAAGNRVPLVARTIPYHQSLHRSPVPDQPPHDWPWLLGLGVLLGGLALLFGRLASAGRKAGRVLLGLESALFGLLVGLPGTVLLLMWLITNHEVTFHNENLFLANPLTLLAVPFGLGLALGGKKSKRRLFKLSVLLAGLGALLLLLKALPWFDQNNWNILGLLLPALLGLAGGTFLLTREPSEAKATLPAADPGAA